VQNIIDCQQNKETLLDKTTSVIVLRIGLGLRKIRNDVSNIIDCQQNKEIRLGSVTSVVASPNGLGFPLILSEV
jgi:hypothetical protein